MRSNDPAYRAGQVVDGKPICGAKTRQGQPCAKPPLPDATRCGQHGGKSPNAQAKAAEVRQERAARHILTNLGQPVEGEILHPVEVLLRLISYKHAEVLWLRAKVQDLSEEDLVWNLDTHEIGVGVEGSIDKQTFKAAQSVWWRLLREAERDLKDLAVAAARAGIEERQVRISESTAQQFLGALRRILDALDLSEAQAALVPQVVPAVLRSLGDTPTTTAR
jgi:hypothetical protein